MPRGLFVFPGLFVVHLDLGILINQFLWRLRSKNECWDGFWANLNWYTSDEVKFSHVKFHCLSKCINNEHYSPSACQKKKSSAPSKKIILNLKHVPINVCILWFWKSSMEMYYVNTYHTSRDRLLLSTLFLRNGKPFINLSAWMYWLNYVLFVSIISCVLTVL